MRAVKVNTCCHVCPRTGCVFTEDHKRKIRLNRPDQSGKKNPNYGKVSALRGRKWEDIRSEEGVLKGMANLSAGLFSGRKHSEKSKEQTRQKLTGENNHFFGKHHTEKTKAVLKIKTSAMIAKGIFGSKNTKPELIFMALLNELGIRFIRQAQAGYWVFDFFLIDYDLYVECDGDYWHSNPKFYNEENLTVAQRRNKGNDSRKNSFIKSTGKKLLRFWEYDLKNNKEFIINQLKTLQVKCA